MRLGRILLLGGPVLWIAAANLAPLIEMARISLLDAYPKPPGAAFRLSLDNYAAFFESPAYLWAFLRSLAYAGAATALALLVSYPVAYAIARKTCPRSRTRYLMLLIAPFWTSEIVRLFALMLLLASRGALNSGLRWLGLIEQPLQALYNPFSVLLGMLYIVLLAMLLPLYAALEKLPADLLDAAAGLGAGPWRRFRDVTVPLTRDGIASGCALVFLVSLGAFAAPTLLGGAGTTVFAMTIGDLFASSAARWPLGAAFGLILLVGGLAVAGLILRLIAPGGYRIADAAKP